MSVPARFVQEYSSSETSGAPSLLVLTFVTGVVDALSVLGFGRVFTANMTGNVVVLAFGVAGAPGFSMTRSLSALAAFLCGAVLGGGMSRMSCSHRTAWLRTALICEAVLLFTAAFASFGIQMDAIPSNRLYMLISLTAVAMGLRNATVRRFAVPDLTTTVLTSTLTGIAADSSLAGGSNPRIVRRTASVLMMFAGAVLGALLLRWGSAPALLLSGVLVLATIPGFVKETRLFNTCS